MVETFYLSQKSNPQLTKSTVFPIDNLPSLGLLRKCNINVATFYYPISALLSTQVGKKQNSKVLALKVVAVSYEKWFWYFGKLVSEER